MSRTRCSWDWVGGYPYFILTNWIDHKKFNVRIIKGIKGNQNALNPNKEKPIMEYICEDFHSKDEVVKDAIKKIKKGRLND